MNKCNITLHISFKVRNENCCADQNFLTRNNINKKRVKNKIQQLGTMWV